MRGKGFTFKQFHIDHSKCAMKVGTDGTLIGAWAPLPEECQQILDIGTGTGLIAIMVAQRHPNAAVTAIDIDADCAEQALENVQATEWGNRIEVKHCSLQEFDTGIKFDVIISNPPYFVDSLLSPNQQRSTARHTATLSFEELTQGVMRLLSPEGTFSLILPPAESERFLSSARGKLFIARRCEVWSTPKSGAKRIMLQMQQLPPQTPPTTEQIIIEDQGPGGYSEQYKALTKDFYLKF